MSAALLAAAVAVAALAGHCQRSEGAVERWRPLVAVYFDDVDTALCVLAHESRGDPGREFDEWAHAGHRKPGGDSQWSAGLYQINAGNLAHTRIRALQGWTPPNNPAGHSSDSRLTTAQARAVLLDPMNSVAAAALIRDAHGWLPAWQAQTGRCALGSRRPHR